MSENCSSSCRTQDHATFGECIRAKGLRVAYCNTAGKGGDATTQKKWDRELDSYRDAVRQGMQPESTRTKDIQKAVQWSEKHGQAYTAEAKQEVRFDQGLARSA